MGSLREKLQGAIETLEIPIPGTEEGYTVRALTGRERAEFAEEFSDVEEGDLMGALRIAAWVLSRGLLNDEGEREYSDDEIEEVMGLPSKILEEGARTIMRLSGISEESVEEGKGDSAPTERSVGGGTSHSPSVSVA